MSRIVLFVVLVLAAGCFDGVRGEADTQTVSALCQAEAAVDADEAAELMGLTSAELRCVDATFFARCASRRFQAAHGRAPSDETRQALNAHISRACLVGGGRTKRVAALLDGDTSP